MNTDETQIKPEKDYSLSPITEQIIGAAYEVHNVLGYGFLEKVYQRAMQVELQLRGIKKTSVFICGSINSQSSRQNPNQDFESVQRNDPPTLTDLFSHR